MFTIFALQVLTNQSTGRRKLMPNKLYYFLDGFKIEEDGRLFINNYRSRNDIVYQEYIENSNPDISITAIVGENGSGKSSLVEFYLRLVNNFAATTIGEFEVNPGAQHLHYIDGVEGELYYMLDKTPYRLRVQNRNVVIERYSKINEIDNQEIFILYNTPDIFDNEMNAYGGLSDESDLSPMRPWRPSRYDVEKTNIKTLKDLYRHFFYTYVSNYSIYAYNTFDYATECNSDRYEELIRKNKKKVYDCESKNWLNGIFHKNDGYQTPIVLSPFREKGNIDINIENTLSRERLISLLITPKSNFRTINGHLNVSGFNISKINNTYNAKYLNKNVGFYRLQQRGYERFKELIVKYWSNELGINLLDYKDKRTAFDNAIGYLIYKTLKVSSKYKQYNEFFSKHRNIAYKIDEQQLAKLIHSLRIDQSHITKKIRQTLSYIIGGLYDFDEEHQYFDINELVDRVNEIINFLKSIAGLTNIFRFPDDLIPAPFFETTIELTDKANDTPVLFETLSSGERQQTYSICALLYHLSNLDSVWLDNNNKRIVYQHVNMVLEEIELYFHPELQRTYINNVLNGIKQLNLGYIKSINICFVTHSPFILSDIPNRNILALDINDNNVPKNKNQLQTFGANIHDMLKNSFFLKQGAIGEYAKRFISKIVSEMDNITSNDNNLHNIQPIQLHEKIMLIDEPIVRMALLTEYNSKFSKNKELEIKELEKRIRELKNEQ